MREWRIADVVSRIHFRGNKCSFCHCKFRLEVNVVFELMAHFTNHEFLIVLLCCKSRLLFKRSREFKRGRRAVAIDVKAHNA